jgi:Ras family protein
MIVYSVASKQSFEMARIIRDKILNHLVSRHVTLSAPLPNQDSY